jgi:S-adenosylmethionine decarboxylase
MNIKSIGKLIAMDMYNCSSDLLSDADKVAWNLEEKAKECNMASRKIIMDHEEGSKEFSVGVSCKQGHVLMHLYPDIGFASIDIFTRRPDAEPDKLARLLRLYFNPDKTKVTYLNRGDFGSVADMKPSYHRNTKTMRRMRNMGQSMGRMGRSFTRIILKPKSL